MGKPSNGPDWTDVLMTMNAVEVTHTCRVKLTITAAGQGRSGGGKVVATALFDTLPGSDLPKQVETELTWPSGKGLGLVGSAYRLLLELDYAIGRSYEQMLLNKK